MKRFLQMVMWFGVLMLALVLAGLFVLPNAKVRASMAGALPGKMRAAREMGSPKVVLAGGSNVSFGMESAEVSRVVEMPVMNLGVYGAFGLKAMLDQALRVCGEGDVIAVFPEYEQLTNRRSFLGAGEGLVSLLCEVDRAGLRDLSGEQWRILFGDFLGYAQTKWTHPKSWWDCSARPWYAADSFNALGDEVGHAGIARRGFERPGVWKTREFDARIGADLLAFVKRAEARGVRMVFVPPVYATGAFEVNEELIAGVEAAMRANGTPFIAPCARYRFDDGMFFDSVYHLTHEAGKARAARVAEDLRGVVDK